MPGDARTGASPCVASGLPRSLYLAKLAWHRVGDVRREVIRLAGTFFDFFATNWQGILVFGLLLLVVGLLVQWFAWIFSRGRFQKRDQAPTDRKTLRFLFADLLVKIIDDFRHLLALVLVVIFALALTYAMIVAAYEPTSRLEAIGKALQAVVSSLGGLIGAIIGYYFGEKAGEKAVAAQALAQSATAPATPAAAGPAAQAPPLAGAPAAAPIRTAPPPPVQNPQ